MAQAGEVADTLDNYWKKLAETDNRVAITFITYFESKEVLFRAFDELSFAEVADGSVHMPEGISSKAQIIKDMNRIALVWLMGRFTRDQAGEVVHVFSKHADHNANQKHLAEWAAEYGIALEKKGKGQLVWIDWKKAYGEAKAPKWKFWK